jgi:FlaA1/EpsC-like NDP-sugar epimerase
MTQTLFAQCIYAVTAPALMIASVVVEAKQESEKAKLFGQTLFEMAVLCVAVFAIYQIPIGAGSKTSLPVMIGLGLALLIAATRIFRTSVQAHKLAHQERQTREGRAHFKAESIVD